MIMEIEHGNVYWFEININSYNPRFIGATRIPCKVISVISGCDFCTIRFMSPENGEIEYRQVKNNNLFTKPLIK